MGLVYAKPNAPCKDCKERHVGCHAECEMYKEYAEENRRRHDEAMKRFQIEQGLEAAEIIRQTRNRRV